MKKTILTIIFLGGFYTHLSANTGVREILNMGCHTHDSTCYITISGAAVGQSSCRGTSVRWRKDDGNGEALFALLSSAFLTGKKISLNIHGCYKYQSHFPTFNYMYVHK